MPDLMTPTELAQRWRRPTRWIREQAKAGAIPAIAVGSRWRFDPDDIARYETRRKTADPLTLTALSAARQGRRTA